jgi:hypothetical protein
LFVHSDKTKEQFEADVKDAYKKYGDEYLAQEEHWAGASQWTDFVAGKLSDYGYVRVSPIQVSCFGAFIIKNEEYDDDDRKFAEEFIGEVLLQKAVKHNEDLEKKMDEECAVLLQPTNGTKAAPVSPAPTQTAENINGKVSAAS